jgi:hypothetical protein
MSRKDFVLIAETMASIKNVEARRIASYALADSLPETNVRFDRRRFLNACNVSK